MKPRSIAALIAINAALLAALVVTLFSPEPAQAQLGDNRQYVMLAGDTAVSDNRSVVYIIDMQSSAMVALVVVPSTGDYTFIGARRIGRDLQIPATIGR